MSPTDEETPAASAGDNYEWRINGDFVGSRSRGDAILSSLVSVRARDVMARGDAPEGSGLDDPSRVTITLDGGAAERTLLFGGPVADMQGQVWFRVEGEELVWAVPEFVRNNLFKTALVGRWLDRRIVLLFGIPAAIAAFFSRSVATKRSLSLASGSSRILRSCCRWPGRRKWAMSCIASAVSILSASGSTSSAGTSHGPTGANVGALLPSAHWPDEWFSCHSRSETSWEVT